MALFNIGKTFFNGQRRDMYLLQGRAVRDGELAPVNGKAHSRASVAATQLQDGTTIFVTVNGWRERTDEVAAIRKGDSILAVGTLNSREWENKTYYDLDAEFVSVSGTGAPKHVTTGVSVSAADFEDDSVPALPFEELDEEDSHLPF